MTQRLRFSRSRGSQKAVFLHLLIFVTILLAILRYVMQLGGRVSQAIFRQQKNKTNKTKIVLSEFLQVRMEEQQIRFVEWSESEIDKCSRKC